MNDLISVNRKVLKDLIKEVMLEEQGNRLEQALTGRTIKMEQFRKEYCGGKSAEWVRSKIFDRYPEVLYENGGWVVNAHGKGSTTFVYQQSAAEWMEEHKNLIDWREKL